MVKDVIHGNH